jgi:hypothetical protein
MNPTRARQQRSLAIASIALLVLIGPSNVPAAAPAGGQSVNAARREEVYYYLVFSNAVAGREDEYNRWYDTQHAPDVVAVPGFVTAQRLVAADAQLRRTTPPTKYLVVYQIVTNDLPAVNREVVRRIQTGQTVMSPAFDGRAAAPNGIFRAMGPVLEHRGWTPETSDGSTYYQLVFVNPVPGRDREFNAWYDQQHLPEMVSMPGFANGRRLQLVEADPGGSRSPFEYLVLYQLITGDLPSVFETFRRRSATMATSPAFGDSVAYTYKTIGPLLSGDEVRRQRR